MPDRLPHNDDTGTTDPEVIEVFRLMIPNPGFPDWWVMWASTEARQRHLEFVENDAPKCTHCGEPAVLPDGTIIPAEWLADATAKPHCATCVQRHIDEMRGGMPPV